VLERVNRSRNSRGKPPLPQTSLRKAENGAQNAQIAPNSANFENSAQRAPQIDEKRALSSSNSKIGVVQQKIVENGSVPPVVTLPKKLKTKHLDAQTTTLIEQ
jgi:hypothetical protein